MIASRLLSLVCGCTAPLDQLDSYRSRHDTDNERGVNVDVDREMGRGQGALSPAIPFHAIESHAVESHPIPYCNLACLLARREMEMEMHPNLQPRVAHHHTHHTTWHGMAWHDYDYDL